VKFNERRKDFIPRNALTFENGGWKLDIESLEIVADSATYPGNRNRHHSSVLFSLPVGAGQDISSKLLEILFEYSEAPAVFGMKSPALSAFAFGRTSAVVADFGAACFSVSRVQQGIVSNFNLGGFAGDWLDSVILKRAESEISAYYPRAGNGNVEKQFWDRSVQLVVQDLKHSVCRVALLPLGPPPERVRAVRKSVGALSYRLPDNTEIDISGICEYVPEILFNPKILAKQGISAGNFPGIGAAVKEISRSGETVVLTGGTSQLPGFASRFETETETITNFQVQRPHSSFTGLSILGSMESALSHLMVTSARYLEEGALRCASRLG